MKIAVVGTRGIPEVMGGVERHCQELYPRLVGLGCEVTVFGRAPYLEGRPADYRGVKVVPVRCPRRQSIEALAHTAACLLRIGRERRRFDVLHVHAIGPALLTPVARLMGLKVVVTNHGPEYERAKWGRLARAVLKAGEWAGARFGHTMIAVSRTIAASLGARFGVEAPYIPNGVNIPERVPAGPYLASLGLTRGRYILAVGRLVPEKGFHDLLAAFRGLATDWRLAIAGGADHASAYSEGLKAQARQDPRVVMTGVITGERLGEVFSNAGLFVLPSYHEGLPIALLEALSYRLPVLVSAIGANLEVLGSREWAFEPGDTQALERRLADVTGVLDKGGSLPQSAVDIVAAYDWDAVARRTLETYEGLFH